jgi:histidyl-tRNA synthetase
MSSKKIFQKPRGTRDILPEEQVYFDYLEEAFRTVIKAAGFSRISTPAFEDTGLFVRGVGKETDIVDKEMYTFKDKSDNSLTLRPEGTAPVVRAYLEDGMQSWPQPVKLYYFMPMYRYDRPQKGRYREFWQLGFEVLGDKSPIADVMVISSAFRIYQKLGLSEGLTLQVNSIGDKNCRPKYIKALSAYLKENEKGLCADCGSRIGKNPLRVLDCKEKKCQEVLEEAPQMVNFLCPECHQHFKEVLEMLDEIAIPYEINPKLVRGLDYYTRTVFEFWRGREGSQNALGGGGRYDELVEILGGKPTPALGFAGGIDRTIEAMKEENVSIDDSRKADIFVAQIGDSAKKSCLKLLNSLWSEDIRAEGCLEKDGISEQLKLANRSGAKYTLLVGQKEAFDDTVIIKEMDSGNQEIYPQTQALKEVKKRIKK